jgi:hypothetical protein
LPNNEDPAPEFSTDGIFVAKLKPPNQRKRDLGEFKTEQLDYLPTILKTSIRELTPNDKDLHEFQS